MGLANYCVPAGEAYQKALDIAFEITQKGMEASLLQKTLKKDGISFLSEAVTVVRVRIECRLLTETFMYHRSYCSKVKEQHSANMTHDEDALKNSWVYHVEMMVTEFCAICIKRNLVDKMMDLPWDSEEEKHLHKSLFDSAQEMPMKPNGRQKLFSNEEKILLNKRVSDLETATSDGLPAIHKAILSKKAAIINYLLRNSANPFIQDKDLLARNAMLAEELLRTGGGMTTDTSQKPSSGRERVQIEALRQELEGAKRQIGALKSEKSQIEAEANNQRNLSVKLESDLKSLSEAYNSIEQANYRLDAEVKALRQGGSVPYPDVEAIKAQAKEEAEKDSEAELNDLLVCLGQEQTKVEKLSTRLTELGEDVDTLLQGIGDDTAIPDDDDEDEDDEE
ncbi:E3 ubiquitin-protein ligase HOS1 [Zea mays]|uniref:E3 ubiquitin-protein ligase HOS1 n=2 Tax=Zea mays TaxID=4577 RepID=A0A1D6QBN3_MAIZE|nr:E3 ubiquitin-protein ligase HOS1 [Zea mays]